MKIEHSGMGLFRATNGSFATRWCRHHIPLVFSYDGDVFIVFSEYFKGCEGIEPYKIYTFTKTLEAQCDPQRLHA